MKKVLTIIIPTYNMEKYLHRCLDSLVIDEEGMKQLEVLVINDGSKDSSSQIAHEYQDKYPDTFRVIDKENGNYGSCINIGIKEAKGKYVKLLDADDWFCKEDFIHLIKLLSKIDVDLVLTNYNIVNKEKKNIYNYNYKAKNVVSGRICDIGELMNIRPVFYGQMHGITYKRQILIEMNYLQTEGISYTDQEWVNIPITHVRNFYYSPLNVYQYLIGREGQTMDINVIGKSIGQLMNVTLKIIEYSISGNYSHNTFNTFLKGQLSIQLNFIYSSCICNNCYPNEKLIEFDDLLSSYPEFYTITNDLVFAKYKYVKDWRRQKRKSLSIVGKIIMKLKRRMDTI